MFSNQYLMFGLFLHIAKQMLIAFSGDIDYVSPIPWEIKLQYAAKSIGFFLRFNIYFLILCILVLLHNNSCFYPILRITMLSYSIKKVVID